jgi:hypothetical protein
MNGLEKLFEQFKDKYYQIILPSGNSYEGYTVLGFGQIKVKTYLTTDEIGRRTVGSDWDGISPLKGFLICKGYPLYAHSYILRNQGLLTFYEVAFSPDKPLPAAEFETVLRANWSKINERLFRVEEVTKLRKIGKESPEMSKEVLSAIALEEKDEDVRQYVIESLLDESWQDVLAKVLEKDVNSISRGIACRRIDPVHNGALALLRRVAFEDPDNWVRRAAMERLDPETDGDLLAAFIKNPNEEYTARHHALINLPKLKYLELLKSLAISDPSSEMRDVSIAWLVEICEKALLDVIRDCINNSWLVAAQTMCQKHWETIDGSMPMDVQKFHFLNKVMIDPCRTMCPHLSSCAFCHGRIPEEELKNVNCIRQLPRMEPLPLYGYVQELGSREDGHSTTFSVHLATIMLPDKPIREKPGLDLEAAIKLALKITNRLLIDHVSIVGEQDDCVYFLWKKDEGIIFPAQLRKQDNAQTGRVS